MKAGRLHQTPSPTLAMITYRAITPQDEEFLYQVYASSREDEMAMLDWSHDQKEAFLKMQFAAQHSYYQQEFGTAVFDIALLKGKPIGRLYLDRRQDEIRIIDIALLTAHRNKGIGSAMLKEILVEAREKRLLVRIHVEQFNPAMRLYARLGFKKIGEASVYHLMEWVPDNN